VFPSVERSHSCFLNKAVYLRFSGVDWTTRQ
jgi:hypothetical protein